MAEQGFSEEEAVVKNLEKGSERILGTFLLIGQERFLVEIFVNKTAHQLLGRENSLQ